MNKLSGIVRLLRPKHWVKNFFVLAPVVFAGHFMEADSVRKAVLAFIAFCIAASATYVLNDIMDVEADRLHPIKALKRPIAAGDVTIPEAAILLALLVGGLTAVLTAFPQVALIIVIYLIVQIGYSVKLKHLPILDIFTIAVGFVLRIYAGAAAITVPVSRWMFATTFAAALYMGAMKRVQENKQHGSASRKVLAQYGEGFMERIAEISATLAVVFYSLFAMTARPEFIITIPGVIFALVRYWYLADKSGAGESPTDLVIKDVQLILVGVSLTAYSIIAILIHLPAGLPEQIHI
jgi:decaprenyl-phosphate phosphoribosyltransferase